MKPSDTPQCTRRVATISQMHNKIVLLKNLQNSFSFALQAFKEAETAETEGVFLVCFDSFSFLSLSLTDTQFVFEEAVSATTLFVCLFVLHPETRFKKLLEISTPQKIMPNHQEE